MPKSASLQVLTELFIAIPRDNRCCEEHLTNGRFKDDDLLQITAKKDTYAASWSEVTDLIRDLVQVVKKNVPVLDFSSASSLSEEEFRRLLGLQRNEFRVLVDVCTEEKSMRNSGNRTIETGVAALFLKLRLGIPQSVIAILLGI